MSTYHNYVDIIIEVLELTILNDIMKMVIVGKGMACSHLLILPLYLYIPIIFICWQKKILWILISLVWWHGLVVLIWNDNMY